MKKLRVGEMRVESKNKTRIMGQAKTRGTFEERKSLAELRNYKLEAAMPKDAGSQKLLRTHGIKRLSTRMVMAGIVASLSQFQVAGKVKVPKEEKP